MDINRLRQMQDDLVGIGCEERLSSVENTFVHHKIPACRGACDQRARSLRVAACEIVTAHRGGIDVGLHLIGHLLHSVDIDGISNDRCPVFFNSFDENFDRCVWVVSCKVHTLFFNREKAKVFLTRSQVKFGRNAGLSWPECGLSMQASG